MIPLRDTIRSTSYPVVNIMIIAINILFFIVELSQGSELDRFIYTYGLVPARYTSPTISSQFTFYQQMFSLLSFMFIHGGLFHLIGNLWSLFIFGDNVEDRLGPIKYFLFYMLCGVSSGLFHLAVNWNSPIPTIGASGAIAGVMGAYMILYPKSKILTLIPIFLFFPIVEIPAVFFLGLWFVFQFFSAASMAGKGGIAWWAHIGGFIFGIIFLKLLLLSSKTSSGGGLKNVVRRNRSARIQTIRPVSIGQDPDMHGTITITRKESISGTRKLINIPNGFKKNLFFVVIPPGSFEGRKLRLAGVGKDINREKNGDLYLKINVED
jgi:membrane associated rhomboid family serine protease